MDNIVVLTTVSERRAFLRNHAHLTERVNRAFPGEQPIDLATDIGDLVVLQNTSRQPIALLGMEKEIDGRVLLNTAMVLEEHRGRGYCPRLVKAVLKHPAYSGKMVHLEVDTNNQAAVSCYRRAGFII